MIELKKKLCKGCGKPNFIFSRGNCVACATKERAKIQKIVKKFQKREKKQSTSVLKKKLIEVFHAFIRKRDDLGGFFICISCDKPNALSNMNAGHFYPATYEAIRFDERNVNGQCAMPCNCFLEGNFAGYTKGMLKKYNQNTIDTLELKKHNKVKMTAFEYKYLIEEYERKIKLL